MISWDQGGANLNIQLYYPFSIGYVSYSLRMATEVVSMIEMGG